VSVRRLRSTLGARQALDVKRDSLELRPLRPSDESSFFATLAEFRAEQPAFEFALGWGAGMSFPQYVARMAAWDRGEQLPAGFVPSAFLVGVVEGEIVGRVSLRYRLNEWLQKIGGHIGYGVRPSARGRGYATAMLRQALKRCPALGIEQALLTCDDTNAASIKVIERCGGVLDGRVADASFAGLRRRYWIRTSAA
jgi:predicted acetyltransferase